MFWLRSSYLVFVSLCFFIAIGGGVHAESVDERHLSNHDRRVLAKSFLSNLKKKLEGIDARLNVLNSQNKDAQFVENILEDGEILLLEAVIEKRARTEGVIMVRYENSKMNLSFVDFISVLNFPIDVDVKAGLATGWYLKESRSFSMDLSRGVVQTHIDDFSVGGDAYRDGDDIWVSVEALNRWLDFDMSVDISVQELHVKTDIPHPLLARLGRDGFKRFNNKVPESSLPLGGEDYTFVSLPAVDVSTVSNYRKRNDGNGVDSHSVNMRSVQDFAKGTLQTNLQFNDRDLLNFARVNYKRDSVEPNLLGPLKARRFEVGDVSGVSLPDGSFSGQEVGVRITNASPVRNFSTPITGISGSGIPGWDVELYRQDQLLDVQQIGEDGFYQFSEVDLFLSDNNFRLVFYGPQGEVREEDVFVPVDRDLLSRNNGVYDVAVSLKGRNSFRKRRADNIDNDSIRVSALYEKPLTDNITAIAGFRSEESNGVRDSVASVGASTIMEEALLNANLSVDDEGEFLASAVVRRDFGEHEARASFDYTMGGFDTAQNGVFLSSFENTQNNIVVQDSFSTALEVNGPLWKGDRGRLNYAVSSDYSWTNEGDYNSLSTAGLTWGLPFMNVNSLLSYNTGSGFEDGVLDLSANVSGRVLGNRVRVSANYDVKPEAELNNVRASVFRRLSDDVDIELSATQRPQRSMTEYQARLDWQAGFIRISPSVRYNSESDFFAGLNTRFGFIPEFSNGNGRFYDENVTNLGLASAFVYLDKDGDGVFVDGVDEPLPDVMVVAPQSGKRVRTDKNGVALFHRLQLLKLTDVHLDKESLQDPTWVSGFEGVSIYPRQGYVAQIDFPVHVSGELDGTVYVRALSSDFLNEGDGGGAQPVALRNVLLRLYNDKGKPIADSLTDSTGFYYFTQIPPGRYFLMVDSKSAQKNNFIRPKPQAVEIGYDGTVIYGNDVFVEAGEEDVPSEVLTDIEDYKKNHPHVDFSRSYDVSLNLGEYNSRLLMSVVWYKIRSRYGAILSGSDLFVPPKDSFADAVTGKHVLRVGLKEGGVSEGYRRCRALMARDQYCKVEIYPSVIKHASVRLEED